MKSKLTPHYFKVKVGRERKWRHYALGTPQLKKIIRQWLEIVEDRLANPPKSQRMREQLLGEHFAYTKVLKIITSREYTLTDLYLES